MKNNNGFTLLEVTLVIIILGILSGFTFLKFQSSSSHDRLQKAANNLYTEIRGLRSLCFKYDEMVMAIFDTDNNKLRIYIDQNEDETIQESEFYKDYELPSPVRIGVCATTPDSWVYNYAPADGLADDWKDTLTVLPDSRGEYLHGGVYLSVPSLKKTVYFVGITYAMQSIELYKWTGTSWIKL